MRTSGSVPDRRRSPQQSPSNHQMMLLARRSDRTTFRKHRLTDTFNLDDKNFLLRNRLAYFHDSEFPLYMHSHDFYEMNIIIEGYGRHYIEDKNFPAVPGNVFVIPPKISHGYWAQNDTMSIFHLLLDSKLFAYLKKIRIDHAVKLLRTTDHSVAFIAQSCGFSDSSHLIRTFKETVGMTPIQFKKANPRAGD